MEQIILWAFLGFVVFLFAYIGVVDEEDSRDRIKTHKQWPE